MKNTTGFGYVIGLVVVVPLLAWAVNFIFYSGNRASDEQVQQYIENSIIEIFPANKKDRLDRGSIIYTRKLKRGGGGMPTYLWRLYYDENYKKFFSLITFRKIHNSDVQINMMMGSAEHATYKVLINKEQLYNPNYGTKENPIPIWPIELLNKEVKYNPEATYLHIQQYLTHFMPKEEYKEMFNK